MHSKERGQALLPYLEMSHAARWIVARYSSVKYLRRSLTPGYRLFNQTPSLVLAGSFWPFKTPNYKPLQKRGHLIMYAARVTQTSVRSFV